MEMSIYRSRGGKTCLILHANKIVSFITQSKFGLTKQVMPIEKFKIEWPKVLQITPLHGLTSYLCVAKRAYRHNAQIINLLWEMFIMQCSTEMSLSELVLCYNKLCDAVNKPHRKSFESKSAALAAIEKLDSLIAQQTPQQEQAESSAKTRRTTMSEKDVEKKPRGKGIGARAMELILEGKPTQEVIDTIKAEIEGANPTPATIAWYKNKLRADGALPPTNRKKKEPAEAEAEAEAA